MTRSTIRRGALVAFGLVGVIQFAAAQVPRRGGRQFVSQVPTSIDLLEMEDIRAELQLGADQRSKLKEIQTARRENLQALAAEMKELTETQRREQRSAYQEELRILRTDVDAQVAQVLTPQQQGRLQQVMLQLRVRRRGAGNVLSEDEIATKLRVNDDQRARMRAIQKEIQKELQEQIRRLRAKSQEQMLDVLSDEQRSQWEAMMGALMPFPQLQREQLDAER